MSKQTGDKNAADELAHALMRVLRWPNPEGTIGEYYLPKWLTQLAEDALTKWKKDFDYAKAKPDYD